MPQLTSLLCVYSLNGAFSFHCFLPLNFERIDPDPEKLKKFWLVPTFLVLKFRKDMWQYLWLSASISRWKEWSSTWWKYFCCEVCIQLGLQTTNFRSERSCPFFGAKLKQGTKREGFATTHAIDSFPARSEKWYLTELHSVSIWLCTTSLSGENGIVIPWIIQKSAYKTHPCPGPWENLFVSNEHRLYITSS